MEYAIARERAIPAMLKDGEHNITSVDAVTQRISYQDAAGSVDFFKSSVPLAFNAVKDAALQSQLKQANAGVMRAMTAYAAWIKKLHPSGTFAIARDAYRKKLQYEDAVDMSLDQYLAYGEAALKQTRAQFVATAHEIDPKASPLSVYLALAKVHPAPNKLLDKARSDLVALRAFIEAKHIVSLPANANITVMETPAFERGDDHGVRRLARAARNGRDASVLQRHAGRPDVEQKTNRRLHGAVQRLRIPDHFRA